MQLYTTALVAQAWHFFYSFVSFSFSFSFFFILSFFNDTQSIYQNKVMLLF